MRRNDIWERWLKKIGEGPDGQPYMEELQVSCYTHTHTHTHTHRRARRPLFASSHLLTHTHTHTHTHTQECKTLTFLGKGYMDAYIAATSCKCAECGAWTMYVCVLTLRPTCFGCFETWCKTHLMSKTKVCVCVCVCV